MLRAIALFVFLAGCGPSPYVLAGADKDAEGKRFSPPAADRAALYVAATRQAGSEISLGQKTLGLVARDQWLRVDVQPGVYTLRCKTVVLKDPGARMEVDLRAGQTTFVSTAFVPLSEPSCRLTPESVVAGQAQVLAGSRILEISGASD